MSITGSRVFVLNNTELVETLGILNEVTYASLFERELLFRKSVNDMVDNYNKSTEETQV